MSEATITCPKCGQPAPAAAKFCPHCGESLEGAKCASCGAAIPAGAKFCPECGKPVA